MASSGSLAPDEFEFAAWGPEGGLQANLPYLDSKSR